MQQILRTGSSGAAPWRCYPDVQQPVLVQALCAGQHCTGLMLCNTCHSLPGADTRTCA